MAHFLWANFLSPHLLWLVLVLPFCAEHRKLWFWAWIAPWSQDTLIWGQMGWPTRRAGAASSVLAYSTDFSARNLLNSSAALATGPAFWWSCTAESLKIKVCSFWQALDKTLFLPKSRAHLYSSSHLLAPSSVFPASHDLVGPFRLIISAAAVALLRAWPSLETFRIAWDPPRLKTGSFPHLKIFTNQPSPLFHFIGCW